MYIVGVFKDGKLLFELCNRQTTYAKAAFACMLFESFNLTMIEGAYIACDLEKKPRSLYV